MHPEHGKTVNPAEIPTAIVNGPGQLQMTELRPVRKRVDVGKNHLRNRPETLITNRTWFSKSTKCEGN